MTSSLTSSSSLSSANTLFLAFFSFEFSSFFLDLGAGIPFFFEGVSSSSSLEVARTSFLASFLEESLPLTSGVSFLTFFLSTKSFESSESSPASAKKQNKYQLKKIAPIS